MGQPAEVEENGQPGQQCCAREVGQDGIRDEEALEVPTAAQGLSPQPWSTPAGFAPKQPSALQRPQQQALVEGL